jgi:hypothetical protein
MVIFQWSSTSLCNNQSNQKEGNSAKVNISETKYSQYKDVFYCLTLNLNVISDTFSVAPSVLLHLYLVFVKVLIGMVMFLSI